MIRGKFEIDYHGHGSTIQEIGNVEIVNTGKNRRSPKYGDYCVRFVDNGIRSEVSVINHLRSDGFFVLLCKAIKKKRKTKDSP